MKNGIINIFAKEKIFAAGGPKRTRALIAIAIALLLFGAFFATRGHQRPGSNRVRGLLDFPDNALKVLVIFDGSSESSFYGEAALRGARAAALHVNSRGGVQGKTIVVQRFLTSEDPDAAYEQLIGILKKNGIHLALDASSSGVSPAVLDAAQQSKVLALALTDGTCRTGSGLEAGKISPYLWSLGLTLESSLEPFLSFLMEKRGRPETEFQVAFLSSETKQDDATIKLVRQTSEGLGFKTLASFQYDVRLNDYYGVAQDILTKGPDLAFISQRLEPTKKFLYQAMKVSLYKDMAIGGLQSLAQEWHSELGEAANGAFHLASYAPGIDTPENKEFLSVLSRPEISKPGTQIQPASPTSANAWGAILSYAKAAQKAKSVVPLEISQIFEKEEFNLPNGTAFFDAKNHVLVQKMYALRIKSGKYEIIDSLGDAHHPGLIGCN